MLREDDCAITSVNLAETIDVCCRVEGLSAQEVDTALDPLLQERLRVLAPGIGDARRAALIHATHYRRATRALSLADCFLLAAPEADDAIATADRDVLAVAKALGIPTVEVG